MSEYGASGYKPANTAYDDVHHQFMCLDESEQVRYFEALSKENQAKVTTEIRRTTRMVSLFRSMYEHKPLVDDLKDSLLIWRSMKSQLRPQEAANLETPLSNPSLSSPITQGGCRGEANDVDMEIEAKVLLFKESQPYSDPNLEATFPNQSIPASKLLDIDNDGNPLCAKCPSDIIRYFHLPANNMIWVEVQEIY